MGHRGYRGLLVTAAVGAVVLAATPARADPAAIAPVAPTPVVDMSVCDAGPVMCPIYGVLLDGAELMVGNTMAMMTYALCMGPVEPGHGAIIPPIVYNYRPWCHQPPTQ